MKGKILEIDGTGSWNSEKYGEMFTYLVRIQADVQIFTGEANSKSETVAGLPYKIGDEVEFEFKASENSAYPDRLKIKKEGQENYGGKAKGNNRSFALSYAKDLAVARITSPNVEAEDFTSTKNIIDQAKKFVEWLDS